MADRSVNQLLIASDHAGFELKELLKKNMPEIPWVDLGPSNADRVDYPDYADRLAERLIALGKESGTRGVLICGSGQGMAIRANRHRGVRAALVWNQDTTRLAREHNDANVICLGARFIAPALAKELINIFLSTGFEGGRHTGRVEKIEKPPRS